AQHDTGNMEQRLWRAHGQAAFRFLQSKVMPLLVAMDAMSQCRSGDLSLSRAGPSAVAPFSELSPRAASPTFGSTAISPFSSLPARIYASRRRRSNDTQI